MSLFKEFSVAEKKKAHARPKVSPARTVVSLMLLLVVGAICFVELRAGFGQMLSGKALAAKSSDGEFTDLPLEDARGLMTLAPKESVETRGPDSVYRFEWYSLLRPLMGQQNPQITIIASNDEIPMALAFTTAEEDREPEASVPHADGGGPAGGPGMMGSGMGGGGGMGMGDGMGRGDGSGSGSKRPDMEEGPVSDVADPAAEAPAVEEPTKEEPAAEPTAEEPAAPAADASAAPAEAAPAEPAPAGTP